MCSATQKLAHWEKKRVNPQGKLQLSVGDMNKIHAQHIMGEHGTNQPRNSTKNKALFPVCIKNHCNFTTESENITNIWIQIAHISGFLPKYAVIEKESESKTTTNAFEFFYHVRYNWQKMKPQDFNLKNSF